MESSRDKLVAAMSELMWERGYASASPREVRERSGVGQGSMYHHFPGKRDLALAAIERNVADTIPESLEVLRGQGDPLSKLVAYLSHQRPALKGCRIGRLTQDPLVVSDPALLEPVGDAFSAVRAALEAVVADAVEEGQLPADLSPARLSALLSATIQGGYVLAIAAQDPQPMRQACEGALDLLASAARAANHDLPSGKAVGTQERNPT